MRLTHFSLLLIPIFLLTSCGKEAPTEKKYFQTATVATGSVSDTESIIVPVEGKDSADLAFKASGRVSAILVREGDVVKKGQILATLGNEEASITAGGLSDVLGDLSGMLGSIGSLYDTRIANLENDREKARIGVELAQKDLDLAKQTLANSISIFSGSILSASEKVAQSQKNLDYANNNLTNSRKLLDIQGESLRKNALNSMSNAFIIARNARDFADQTLGVTEANKHANDSFEVYLGAKNSATKTQAEAAFRSFDAEYATMYAWYYANIVDKTDISKETLNESLTRSLSTLEHLRDMLHAVSTVLENSITSSTFTDSDLSGLKNRTSTFLSNLELAILDGSGNGVKGSIAAIDTFDSSYDLKIQQLEDAVNLAQEDLNLAKTGKDASSSDVRKNLDTLSASVKMKEDALSLARVAISEVEKNVASLRAERDSKLREVDAKLSETRMNRNLAGNSIESGILRAPYDGVIVKKYTDTSMVVSPGMPILRISSTQGKLAKLSFDNAVYGYRVGDRVSFRDVRGGESFTGTFTLINANPDTLHRKNSGEIDVSSFSGSVGERVDVRLAKKGGPAGLVIPASAIIRKYSEPGVYVLDGKKAVFTFVKILASDSVSTLIDGLTAGQTVITEGKENIVDGEEVR